MEIEKGIIDALKEILTVRVSFFYSIILKNPAKPHLKFQTFLEMIIK